MYLSYGTMFLYQELNQEGSEYRSTYPNVFFSTGCLIEALW